MLLGKFLFLFAAAGPGGVEPTGVVLCPVGAEGGELGAGRDVGVAQGGGAGSLSLPSGPADLSTAKRNALKADSGKSISMRMRHNLASSGPPVTGISDPRGCFFWRPSADNFFNFFTAASKAFSIRDGAASCTRWNFLISCSP